MDSGVRTVTLHLTAKCWRLLGQEGAQGPGGSGPGTLACLRPLPRAAPSKGAYTGTRGVS